MVSRGRLEIVNQFEQADEEIFLLVRRDQLFDIHLDPGYYTSEQLVHALNKKFKGAGTDITVGFEGDSLVYHSPTKVLDSFGGSMIEIDSPASHTSIIYDNSKPGYISGAYFLGAEYLSGDVTFDSSNTLTFCVGNSGTYTNRPKGLRPL